MRLNRLVLTDFGLYRGRQEISLAPRTKYGKPRPIVLVGGHNGAGKTTILEAIRLCLYGRLALGPRVREQDYSTYLRERIHRNPGALLQPNSASVAIEFDYARGGKVETFLVERSWTNLGGKVSETLAIYRGGQILDEVDSDFWPEFLRSLVPPGLSELFFFDGEKIQKLAEDASDSDALADSVKSLLGLNLVERLQADLDLFLSRAARKTNASGQIARLPQLEQEVGEAEKAMEVLRGKRAELRNQAEFAAKEVEKVEQLLAVGGHGLADRRSDLMQRKARLSARAGEISKSLRELCDGPLPVTACPTLAKSLVAQLESEAKLEEWTGAHSEVDRALGAVQKRITSALKRKKLGSETAVAVRNEIEAARAELSEKPDELKALVVLHGVSSRERQEIEQTIRVAMSEARAAAKKACSELVKIDRQLTSVQEKLNKAPDDEEIAPKIRELSLLHQRETQAREGLAVVDADIAEAEKRLGILHRERKRLLDAVAASGKADRKWGLAGKTRDALETYLHRLTAAKVKQLEAVTMECFKELCRKDDLVTAIHINAKTFQVELADKTGNRIPKSALSAGEKQIYAISVLWGLARVSGRPLPMIIDTPLGRLDSIHRTRLVEAYFPRASHQVIVLSTDTEVDATYFDGMRSHISHAVHLVHREDGWTQAEPGYFWKEGDDGAAAA
jgi:DNA sulfur modification protein DndD